MEKRHENVCGEILKVFMFTYFLCERLLYPRVSAALYWTTILFFSFLLALETLRLNCTMRVSFELDIIANIILQYTLFYVEVGQSWHCFHKDIDFLYKRKLRGRHFREKWMRLLHWNENGHFFFFCSKVPNWASSKHHIGRMKGKKMPQIMLMVRI